MVDAPEEERSAGNLSSDAGDAGPPQNGMQTWNHFPSNLVGKILARDSTKVWTMARIGQLLRVIG
jgi:hypothetical protein